jgi:hypothetical protein
MNRKPDGLLLGILVAAEVVLAIFTLRDIQRRPAEQIRGSKWLWRVVSVINPGNSVAYWLAGRRYGRCRRAGRAGEGSVL